MKNLMLSTFLVLVCLYSNSACSETVYVHNDILGSPIMETNSSGTVTSRSHYKPFGEALEGMKQGVGYTGHLNDKDLELTYMQARYYDPVIGRFYSNDPIGVTNVHTFNRYAYANNNPYKYTDPNGESAALAACAAGPLGCAVGVVVTIAAAYHGVEGTRKALEKRKRDPKFGKKVKDKNREKNDGDLVCDGCGIEVQDGKRRKKGEKVPANEGQADHIDPLADGGADDAETNGQVLCAGECHKEKTREENRERARKRREEREKNN